KRVDERHAPERRHRHPHEQRAGDGPGSVLQAIQSHPKGQAARPAGAGRAAAERGRHDPDRAAAVIFRSELRFTKRAWWNRISTSTTLSAPAFTQRKDWRGVRVAEGAALEMLLAA